MNRIMIPFAVAALVACTKRETRLWVNVRANSVGPCAVQWDDREGVFHYDTIGGYGHWNLSRLDGETVHVIVCPMTPQPPGFVSITVDGDVEPFTVATDSLHLCAVVDRPVFRQ